MQYEYKTKGTCSQRIFFEVEDGKVKNVSFVGGCNGNLKGISALVGVWTWTPSSPAWRASTAA